MAHHKSALKRIRQNRTHKIYNRLNKKAVKTAVRNLSDSKTFEEANDKLKKAFSVLDRVTAHGVVHKNWAARKKSVLSKMALKLKTDA